MNLTEKQKKVIYADEDKIIVLASAGSGKTTCLVEHVRNLLKRQIQPSSIAVITFTSLAAQELKKRLADDYKEGMFVGTIHALAYNMLTSHGISCDDLINKEQFNDFFTRLEEHPECIKHYNTICLDEGHDISPNEINFIFNMVDPERYFLILDPKQQIYGFRGSNHKYITGLMKQYDVTTYELTENFRNPPAVLSFAQSIIKKNNVNDNSIPFDLTKQGQVVKLPYNTFRLVDYINSNGDYSDWTILCRTNAQVNYIQNELLDLGIPTTTFKQGGLTEEELNQFLTTNKVRVITIHSSKGLTLKNVAVLGVRYYSKEEIRLQYVAATRPTNLLLWFENDPLQKKSKTKVVKWS